MIRVSRPSKRRASRARDVITRLAHLKAHARPSPTARRRAGRPLSTRAGGFARTACDESRRELEKELLR